MLNIIYNKARYTFPLLIKSPVSNAKEEKVVKPPHIPTFINKIILGFNEFLWTASATMIPMIKEPMIFTISVFIGKSHLSFIGIKPIKYRQTAPINHPIPTTKQSIIIHSSFFFILY